jgi:Asp/Glu/hydantoin racemase
MSLAGRASPYALDLTSSSAASTRVTDLFDSDTPLTDLSSDDEDATTLLVTSISPTVKEQRSEAVASGKGALAMGPPEWNY